MAGMPLEQWWHDLHAAGRGLLRARGFTGTAVFTLGLGMAGATVMFALVEGVLLRPLPVRDEGRLVVAWKELRSGSVPHWPLTRAEIDAIDEGSQLLDGVAGVGYNGAPPGTMVEDGTLFSVRGAVVTGAFFEVMGIEPVLGRALGPRDDVPGAENALVITHELWQRRYGGSPDVIGRRLTVDVHPFTIVGVMPASIDYPRGVETWTTVEASASTMSNPTFRNGVRNELDLVARLRPGVTLEQARAEVQAWITRLEAETNPGGTRDSRASVQSFADVVVGDVRRPLMALFAAVGLLLLIATANVANLLLLRGETRRGETALRAALGARPGRLARQLLSEGVLLGLAAGVLGLVAASWALPVLVALLPAGLPRIDSVHVDPAVVAFSLGGGVLAAALASAAPVARARRIDLLSQLGGSRTPSLERGVQRGRRTLVVAQVALAVTVVAAAGLLSRSLLRLQAADTGLAADRLVFVGLGLPQAKYSEGGRHLRFLNEVIERFEAEPHIEGATPVNKAPFSGTGGWDVGTFSAEGQDLDGVQGNPSLNFEAIHPNYFATLGVTILRGRAFTEADRWGTPEVVVLTEDLTERLWPGEDPIGKRLKIGRPDGDEPWRTVVGVVASTRYRELADPRPTLYMPAQQLFVSATILALRTGQPLPLVADQARQSVRALDPDVEVTWVAPFRDLLDGPLARPRFNALLIGLFALAALVLALVGLYAVMGTYVRQRDAELGIRMALGASVADVRRLVLGEGLRLAVFGAVLGLGAAVAGSRVLRGVLFGVDALDPVSLLGAAGLLVGAAVLASYLPARRATQVDPGSLLRTL